MSSWWWIESWVGGWTQYIPIIQMFGMSISKVLTWGATSIQQAGKGAQRCGQEVGNYSSTALYMLFLFSEMILQVVFPSYNFSSTRVVSRILQEELSKHVFLAGEGFFSQNLPTWFMLYKYLQLSGSSSGLPSKTIMVGEKGGINYIHPWIVTFQKTVFYLPKKSWG